MRFDIEVETEELRLWAALLRRSAARLRLDPWPADDSGDSARRVLGHIVADLEEFAHAVAASAEDYERADARAAGRLS
jgi:hypothetical protein